MTTPVNFGQWSISFKIILIYWKLQVRSDLIIANPYAHLDEQAIALTGLTPDVNFFSGYEFSWVETNRNFSYKTNFVIFMQLFAAGSALVCLYDIFF